MKKRWTGMGIHFCWILGLLAVSWPTAEVAAVGDVPCKTDKDCDDKNGCTKDHCGKDLFCAHENHEGACDDGNACTEGDHCAKGNCVAGSEVKCDDKNPCTDDSCDPASGCAHEDNSAPCEDGNECTIDDTCAKGICQGGSALSCDDEKPCTDDACDPKLGCTHTNREGTCDDGNACSAGDHCAKGECKGESEIKCDDKNDCTDDFCDPKSGCGHESREGRCDDGNACTTEDTCAEGQCAGGPAPNCDDEKPCTDDSCDPKLGCVHANHEGSCDDGNPCTGGDACQKDKCIGEEINCDDGLFCNGHEKCSLKAGCIPGDDPCPEEKCDEELDSCIKCLNDADCDDGHFCNGVESCNPIEGCYKGDKPCPELCDEETDQCTGCDGNPVCDDGLFCNGEEKCHPELGCRPGFDPCPEEACDEETDTCSACTSDADCDDEKFCNGAELCIQGKCEHGAEPCPAQLCNEKTGECESDVNPKSAFGIKSGVAEQLGEWLGEGGNPATTCDKGDENLGHARSLVQMSLGGGDSEIVWGDADHIDPAHGGAHGADVFHAEIEACQHLDAYLLDKDNEEACPEAGVMALRLALAAADRRLAETAIADAEAAGADPAAIAEAQGLLAAADAMTKAGDVCGQGLAGYEAAWELAVYSYSQTTLDATQSLVYSPMGRGAAGSGPWITISAPDLLGYGPGIANFIRAFPIGAVVTLTAPMEYDVRPLLGWRVNGVLQPGPGDGSLLVQVDVGNDSFEVVYGECSPLLFGDVTPVGGNGLIDVDDLLYVLDAFISDSACTAYPRADLFPCGTPCVLIDVDDILTLLNAFLGAYACPHPCPP